MNGAVSFEEAISLTGYGNFHYGLVSCCAICLLSNGLQNGLHAYALPKAQCDLDLTSTQIGYLNIAFMVGGICSAFLWGLLGDMLGRRKVLVVTLLCDWVMSLCSGLSQSFAALMVFRTFNGFLTGAPGTLVYSYIAEFHPERMKAKSICYTGMFFTLAWIILPATAWIIMPLPWELRFSGFVFNSWRLFIIVLSLPSLIGGLWIFHLPESPKFLLSRGDSKQALTILKNMFSRNTGHPEEDYAVKILVDDVNIKQVITNNSSNGTVGPGRTVRLIKEAKEQMKRLFRPPLLSLTILTSVIMFSNMFGYLGLGLWIPVILHRFDEHDNLHPDEKITICEFQSLFDVNATSQSLINGTNYLPENDSLKCQSNGMNETVFINTILMGASCMIGNVISGYLTSYVSRRTLPIVTMLIGAISAVGIYWLNTSMQQLIVTSLFQASMSTANMTINSVLVELFPTNVSAMAVCTATLVGRLGSVVSNLALGILLDKSCEIPIFLVAAVLAVGGALGFFIPSAKLEEKTEQPVTLKSISDISVIPT